MKIKKITGTTQLIPFFRLVNDDKKEMILRSFLVTIVDTPPPITIDSE